ncbi:formylmethanofuran dehydrogenase subunit E [Anaerolineae bacterium]|nr:formylmethanofuran dehydrogenase subunit E [Anaerolineae bacterium]
MLTLKEILEQSAAMHHHLCPRQVLGARLGLLAGVELGLSLPQSDKRLLTIIETDGCLADGVAVATGCTVGHRTLRVEDYGKVAATCIDTQAGRALRLAPRRVARQAAGLYAPEARNKWEAQLLGYQRMPDDELFSVQAVQLTTPVAQIVSRPGRKAICDVCGEEIINERETLRGSTVLCHACAGNAYYTLTAAAWPTAAELFAPQELVTV